VNGIGQLQDSHVHMDDVLLYSDLLVFLIAAYVEGISFLYIARITVLDYTPYVQVQYSLSIQVYSN